MEKYLTIKEAAEIMGVTKPTVEREMRNGSLPFIEIGPHSLRIDPVDLRNLMESRKKVGRPEKIRPKSEPEPQSPPQPAGESIQEPEANPIAKVSQQDSISTETPVEQVINQ